MGFVGNTANLQQYFDFGKWVSQTNFQTAGVSVDALTSLIQSCGMGDSSGPWSAGSTDRRIVVFPLTEGQEQHQLKLNQSGLGVEFHSEIYSICSLYLSRLLAVYEIAVRAERSSIQRHIPCVHRPASVTGFSRLL